MLYQLSHANENDDGVGYIIKHAFVRASSLFHAHVFVTLFGYRISPEYYEDNEEPYEPDEQHVQNTLRAYSLEQFEKMNEECSYGEHFWHSLKTIARQDFAVYLGGMKMFKVTIQFKMPCKHQCEADPRTFTLYRMEMNTDIYQFTAPYPNSVLQHVRQNSDSFCLTDFFRELPNELDWQTIEQITEERMQCANPSHLHDVFICMKCEELQSPLPVIDSNL